MNLGKSRIKCGFHGRLGSLAISVSRIPKPFLIEFITHSSTAFALRPLRVARDLGWCVHDYPRWDGHNATEHTVTCPVLVSPASLIGSELPQPSCAGLRLFALPPVAGA